MDSEPRQDFSTAVIKGIQERHGELTTLVAGLGLSAALGPLGTPAAILLLGVLSDKKVEDFYKSTRVTLLKKAEDLEERHGKLAFLARRLASLLPHSEKVINELNDAEATRENLRKLFGDKEFQEEFRKKVEKLFSSQYKNQAEFENELKELFQVESANEAVNTFLSLKDILFNKTSLEILTKIANIEKQQEEIIRQQKETIQCFEKLEKEIDKKFIIFLVEIQKENTEIGLTEEGFEIITPYELCQKPNSDCWNEIIRINDVFHGYDARRRVTDKVLYGLSIGKNVLIKGESGYGKTTLLYRLIVESMNNYDLVIFNGGAKPIKNTTKLKFLIKKLASQGTILIVVDNVQRQNAKIFKVMNEMGRDFKGNFLLSAREPEFTEILKRRTDVPIDAEIKQEIELGINKITIFEPVELKLNEKEKELFVKRYHSLKGKGTDYKKFTKKDWRPINDPLIFTFFLTRGRGLKQDVLLRYEEMEKQKDCETLKDIVLFSCISGGCGLEIYEKDILKCLKIKRDKYSYAMNYLTGRVLYKSGEYFMIRHPRWAVEYVNFIINTEGPETKKILKKKFLAIIEYCESRIPLFTLAFLFTFWEEKFTNRLMELASKRYSPEYIKKYLSENK